MPVHKGVQSPLVTWGVSGVNQSDRVPHTGSPVPSRYIGQGRNSKPSESGVTCYWRTGTPRRPAGFSGPGLRTVDPRRHETPARDYDFRITNFDLVNLCTNKKISMEMWKSGISMEMFITGT
jgi:hypothetical protein